MGRARDRASADLNGQEFILDADADTSISADTDDQIDIRIAGADDFQFTANTFTAQSGSTIAAQALTATTVTATGDVSLDGGNFVFNESSADKDFRIESNGNANIFVVDGGNDKVGIGGSPAFSTEIISSSTDTSLTAIGASQLVVTNTGSATTNQMAKIALRLADGSLNGNSFIAGLRESSSSRAMSMVFANADTSGGDPAERVRIATGGDVTLTGGDLIFATSGKGINLGVTSNTDSNTLDDYEEGTFNVTATVASGALTISGSYNKLSYTKIGQRVFISGGIRLADATASGSPSGSVHLDDLPFTPASADEDSIHSVFFIAHDSMTGLSSNGQAMIGQVLGGNNNIYIFTQDQNGFADPGNHFTDNSLLRFNFSYIAA